MLGFLSRKRPTEQRVFLHVGQGKTGTSFIQSVLALSRETLWRRYGIRYPIATGPLRLGQKGHISSGNFHANQDDFADFAARFRLNQRDDLLISNEALAAPRVLNSTLEAVRGFNPGAAVHVLLFIRNPLDQAVSHYSQGVKRGGFHMPFEEFLSQYNSVITPNFLMEIERQCASATIFNYSYHDDRLVECLAGWLGMSPDDLSLPPNQRVNRSLSEAELACQRAVNRKLGKSGQLLSDWLCNELPEINAGRPRIAAEALTAFLGRMGSAIDSINHHLPESERYSLPTLEDAIAAYGGEADDNLTLSGAQFEVMFGALSAEIARLRAELGTAKLVNLVRAAQEAKRAGRPDEAAENCRQGLALFDHPVFGPHIDDNRKPELEALLSRMEGEQEKTVQAG